MRKFQTILIVLTLAPKLVALDVETLDGKAYKNCTVSRVDPDAICFLFPGGGARVKFTNLPEKLRVAYAYDPEKAAAYEKAQALKKQREDALWQAARLHADARRKAAESNAVAAASTNQFAQRTPAAYGGGNQGQGGYGGNSQYGGGYSSGGSEYVGVTLANGGNFAFGQGGGGGYGGGNQGGWGGGTGMGTVYYGVSLAPRQGGAFGGGQGQQGGYR